MNSLEVLGRLTETAFGEVDTREIPPDSNSGPRVREYQEATYQDGSGWPWSEAFVCWCIQQWGKDPEVLGLLDLTAEEFEDWRPKTVAAYEFEEWAAEHGLMLVDDTAAGEKLALRTGDLVIYNFPHIGIVYNGSPDGTRLCAIEGDTGEDGSQEDGGVYLKQRDRSLVRSIIRILP